MLKSTLKEVLREVIREELHSALYRTITVEKGPEKQGDPETRIESQDVNVLDFLAQYLPQIEGRLLGTQADMNKVTNAAKAHGEKVELLGRALMGLESSARAVAELSDTIRALEIAPLKLVE